MTKQEIKLFKELIGNQTDEFISLMRRQFEERIEEYAHKECLENEIEETLMYDIFFMKKKFTVQATFDVVVHSKEKYGAIYYDLTVVPNDFIILSDEIRFDDIDIVDVIENDEKCELNLFDDIEISDIEGEIVDPYEFYGVNRGDFF